MLSFARIVYGFKLLNIVAKLPILHVCGGPSYASDYFRIKYDDKIAYLFPEWLVNQVYYYFIIIMHFHLHWFIAGKRVWGHEGKMWVRKLFTEQKTIDSNYKLFSTSSASPCGCSQLSAILVWFINFSNMIGKKIKDLLIRLEFHFFAAIFSARADLFLPISSFLKVNAHAETKLKRKILLKRINQNAVNQPLIDHFE